MKLFRALRQRAHYGSSYLAGAPFKPDFELTMNDLLVKSCERNDAAPLAWFQEEDKHYTYGTMNTVATQIGCGFLDIGLQCGDRLGIWGTNSHEWLVTKWAAYKVGLELVTLNPLYTTKELEYTINKVGIRAIICPEETSRASFHERVDELVNLDKQSLGAINAPNVPTLKSIVYYKNKTRTNAVFDFDELYDAADSQLTAALSATKVNPMTPANIQFTSGTTGAPKAAALSHFNIVNNARQMEQYYNTVEHSTGANSRTLNMLPLFHVFGFVGGSTTMTLVGGQCIYPSTYFDAKKALSAIELGGATTLIGTPTMLIDLLGEIDKRPDADVTTINRCSIGGAPVSPSLVEQTRDVLGAQITVGYGMTENTCGTIGVQCQAPTEEVTGSVGRPFDGIEVRVIDVDTLADVEQGQIGEICIRGDVVFSGYVGDEAKTQESRLPDGWWRTGDLGLLQDNGTYNITGRLKDMIIRGGENIQPTEIENALNQHPAIEAAFVIGIPHERLGEEVAAYIKLIERIAVTTEDIRTFAELSLAKFKVPKHIKLIDAFPLTPTGKVKKIELREWAKIDFCK